MMAARGEKAGVISRAEAEQLCEEMNHLFSVHDRLFQLTNVPLDIARKKDAAAQAIKARLIEAGWALTVVDKRFVLTGRAKA